MGKSNRGSPEENEAGSRARFKGPVSTDGRRLRVPCTSEARRTGRTAVPAFPVFVCPFLLAVAQNGLCSLLLGSSTAEDLTVVFSNFL